MGSGRSRCIRRREFGRFIHSLEALPEMVTEFSEELWGSMIDHVTVHSKDNIVFTLTSGMTGYVPNRSDSAVSDTWDGVFESIGDPHAEDSSCAGAMNGRSGKNHSERLSGGVFFLSVTLIWWYHVNETGYRFRMVREKEEGSLRSSPLKTEGRKNEAAYD